MMRDGPECDFCHIALDEDEELQPIYIGEPPKPEPHRLRAIEKKVPVEMGYRVLGYEVEAFAAMYSALRRCTDIDVNISRHVEELTALGGETHMVDLEYGNSRDETQVIRGDVSLESRINDDMTGVTITIKPKNVDVEPDAMICEDCSEMFKNL